MQKILFCSILILFIPLFLIAQTKEAPIIPYPKSLEFNDENFKLSPDGFIRVDTENIQLARILNTMLGISYNYGTQKQQQHSIDISIDTTCCKKPESYKLNVINSGINITANNYAGVFYAIQTLAQLKIGDKVMGVNIYDEPRFVYRGIHLDVSRHFFTVDEVKKLIDAMAFYKYNTFHWHLCDDQGWRIEIQKYPKLTEIGSVRSGTKIGSFFKDIPHRFDSIPETGFYTQQDIKDVVLYAKERCVNIIPEIELPGHATAALASYNYLGCKGENYEVAKNWGVYSTIYCAGKESTFEFLEDVIDEVLELFPSEYIHIGGDEANKRHWEACELCNIRMQEEELEDSHQLQAYFVKRIKKYINAKGRKIIGWDEIMDGGLEKGATIMSWRGRRKTMEAAKKGYNVIATPIRPSYFDFSQTEDSPYLSQPAIINSIEKVYEYNPIPSRMPIEHEKYVIGAQANLWTEYVKTAEHMEYMFFPRACALAEVLWSPTEKQEFDKFKQRLKKHYPFLDKKEINYYHESE